MAVQSSGPAAGAALAWAGLDEPWREAFRQAWDAVRSGSIGVGACASTPDGEVIHSARNRVNDADGPHGEIFGSSLAHAEMNVLARLGFRRHQGLVLTTTLQPCLQCAGAIRLARIATVRFAGHDRYWDGYHDFARLATREAYRATAAPSRPWRPTRPSSRCGHGSRACSQRSSNGVRPSRARAQHAPVAGPLPVVEA